jgi:hypothetical protein
LDLPLASVEAAALTQGVTFLYQQAGELLRRRREAKDRAADAGRKQQETTDVSEEGGQDSAMLSPVEDEGLPVLEPPTEAFATESTVRRFPRPGVLDELSSPLLEAQRNLDTYVLGDKPIEPNSTAMFQAVDRLRRLLEQVYGARLTFAGEQRRYTDDHSVTINRFQEGGITAGGFIKANGDIAGHDVNKR